jgi:two-component system sensor histidine kinase DesK
MADEFRGVLGLVFCGAFGLRRTRRMRLWRAVLSGAWLAYISQPMAGLFSHHHSALYIGGAVALTTVFSCYYMWLIFTRDSRRWPPYAGPLPLFTLAALVCVRYGGATWNVLWIYVAAACGLVIEDQRLAIRAVLAAAASFVLFSWLGHARASEFVTTLIAVAVVGLAMIGVRIQIELTRELSQARETVARLAASEERLRLARDMHDLTGQSLSMITLKAELAARLLGRLPDGPDRDRVRAEVDQVAAVSRQTLQDIREAVSGYRRPTLDVETITARTALEAAGITPHASADLMAVSGTIDPDAEAALAWCLREAVTNVVRHSGATHCHISLLRRGDTMSLIVRDDGHGHVAQESDPSGTTGGGSGLHGMSERLSAVGGDLEIAPGPGRGLRLTATVPVRDRVSVTV